MTLGKGDEHVTPKVVGLSALSNNSAIAVLLERGATANEAQRLLTRRYAGRGWQQPEQHDVSEPGRSELLAVKVASGPGASAALLWVANVLATKELRLRRTTNEPGWSDPAVVYASPQYPTNLELVIAPDGSRLAALWQIDDAWWARLIDGDEPTGEATELACNCSEPPAAAFDARGQLLLAWGNEQGPATLASFDGTQLTTQPLGHDRGAATNPKLTAVPAGPIMVVWEQHDGPASDMVGDMEVPTSTTILSANIVDGEPQDARPIVR